MIQVFVNKVYEDFKVFSYVYLENFKKKSQNIFYNPTVFNIIKSNYNNEFNIHLDINKKNSKYSL